MNLKTESSAQMQSTTAHNNEARATGFMSVMNLHAPRSWLALVGFFFFHFIMYALLNGVVTLLCSHLTDAPMATASEGYESGLAIGRKVAPIVAAVYCFGLYTGIMYFRNAWKNPWYFIGWILSLGLGGLGMVFGLIPSLVTLGIIAQRSKTAAKTS